MEYSAPESHSLTKQSSYLHASQYPTIDVEGEKKNKKENN